MGFRPAAIGAIVFPFGVAGVASPGGALYGQGDAQECADVGDGAVEFLEVDIQRLTFGATRLLVEPDTVHVKTFENGLIQNILRAGYVRGAYLELDSANEVRNKPIQANQIFVR